jgi:hypothetical protein
MEIPRVAHRPGSAPRLPEDTISVKRFLWPTLSILVLIVINQVRGGLDAEWPSVWWLALVPVAAPLFFWMFRKESDRLFDAAGARGLNREPGETLQRAEYAALPLPYPVAARRFSRVVRGRVGAIDVWVFTVNSSESDSSVIPGVVAFDLGADVLPAFEARPRGVTDVRKRVEFPEDPEFAGRWHVTADDPAAVRRLLSPGARRALTQLDEQWWIHARGRWLVTYRQNRYLAIRSMAKYDWRSFDAVVDTAARILSAITGR